MWTLSGIRPFSLLRCSRRLFNQKRWESLFVFVWGWFASILKRIPLLCCRCFICLLICLQVSGIKSVTAADIEDPDPGNYSLYLPSIFAPSGLAHVTDQMTVYGLLDEYIFLNGEYDAVGAYNGKMRYEMYSESMCDIYCAIYWSGGNWYIDSVNYNGQVFYGDEDVEYPSEVGQWHAIVQLDGQVDVISSGPTDSPTPTPTMHPLFPTSTPGGSGTSYECPGTQPIGFGVATPGVNWMLHCSNCITPVPQYVWPTVQPGTFGTATPPPGGTATPPPGDGTLDVQGLIFGNMTDLVEGEIYDRVFTNANQNTGIEAYATVNYPRSLFVAEQIYVDSIYFSGPDATQTMTYAICAAPYANGGIDVEIVSSTIPGVTPTTYHINQNSCHVYNLHTRTKLITYSNLSWDISYKVTILLPNSYGTAAQYYANIAGFSYNTQTYGELSTVWYNDGFPPPNVPSYCDQIEDDEYGMNDPEDPNFKLPYIGVGEGVCTGIPSVTLSMAWLQVFWSGAPSSLTFGGVQFCFAPISFGSLNIFGLPIDLDLMSMGIAGVLLFKIITR